MRKESSLRRQYGSMEAPVRPGTAAPRNAAERVRPRRKRRRPSFLRNFVIPFVGCAIACSALYLVVSKVSRPFELYGREKHATQELQKQLDTLRAQNEALARRVNYLKTPEGRAQAARELGWVKPGEISLVIPQEKQPKPNP